MSCPSLRLVMVCRDCAQSTTLTIEADRPDPALVCRVCGGARWQLVAGALVPASASEVAK